MTPLFATFERDVIINSVFLAVAAAIWTWICVRRRQGRPIIPLARRRPVPWQAQDVLFIFLMYYLFPILAIGAVQTWTGIDAAEQVADQKPELSHPAEQLLRTSDPGAIAVSVVLAVLVAPLIEEFIFRVLLQGWLEAVWTRRRTARPELRSAPFSWLPIVLPAALFALLHGRSGRVPLTPEFQTLLFLVQMEAYVVTLYLAIKVLRFAAGATAADLGWKPEKLRTDAKLGLVALLAVIGPVLALQGVLTVVVKRSGIDCAPDPVPLFFLALALGVLYHRTHRLAPSLVLHMAFNATSVIGLLLA